MLKDQRRAFKIMESLEWYHGNISRHMAEALLIANGKEGSFLLRSLREGLCLSVRGIDSVKHFKVEITRAGVTFANSSFENLEKFLKVVASQAILCGQTGDLSKNYEQGTLLTLKYPYPNKVAEPDYYDEIMTLHSTVHTMGTSGGFDIKSKATPLASMSGFLVKQGGNIKSWKRRWFVILRNEMSYFEDRTSDKPIRILNLEECSRVSLCNIPGKSHCFYLEFPDRLWHFSANSAKEVQEWTSIIQWKLDQNRLSANNNGNRSTS